MAAIGLTGIWIPFVALSGFGGLAGISSGGLPAVDWPLFGYAAFVSLIVPLVGWFAYRTRGVAAAALIFLVGLLAPLLYVPQIREDYSEPLRWVAEAALLFGFISVIGALMLLRGAKRR
jgi:hypothetical protein